MLYERKDYMRSNGETEIKSGGIGFCGLLTIVFIVLKLGAFSTSVMTWSWWWVLSPLWIPFVIILVLALIVGIIAAIANN